jgi:hypothetical protein
MNKIFILLVSVLILCDCSFIQNSKVYSTDYENGVVIIKSNDILLNIFEKKRYLQYQLMFNGKELIKKFAKEISKEEYYDSYERWTQQLTKNILYPGNPYTKELPREYIKILTKKIGDIVITHFDKVEIKLIKNVEHYTLISKMEIKIKNKSENIIMRNSNIFDFTVIKIKDINYLLILHGSKGAGAFLSMIDIYKLN